MLSYFLFELPLASHLLFKPTMRMRLLLHIFLAFTLFTSLAYGAINCGAELQSPKSNFTKSEIEAFVIKRRILNPEVLSQIKSRLKLFELDAEDLGNAFMMHVFSELGPHPSRQRDEMVKEFLSPIFDYYQKQFERIAQTQQPGVMVLVPNFFGLADLGFKPDSYKNIHWTAEQSQRLASLMKTEFSKPMGFDLVAANRLLLQMVYVNSRLNHDKSMSLQDLKLASDNYFQAEKDGQVFIPAIGAWSSGNALAQWHLKANVNMLPLNLSENTMNHAKPMSALAAMVHDHSHYTELRRAIVADAYFKSIIEKALKKHSEIKGVDSTLLSVVIFQFVHDKEPLVQYAYNYNIRSTNQAVAAKHLLSIFKKDPEHYGWSRYNFTFEQFEAAAEYWFKLLLDK